jgi:hypothetical protein
MSTFMTMLLLVGAGVLVVSLLFTWSLGKTMKRSTANLDGKIPEGVQSHAYIRNPIFLSYLITMLIALIVIVYFAVSTTGS